MSVSSARQLIIGMAGVVLVSGCAGQRTAQTINRLQSSVDLLDQRVAQLERTGLSDSASSDAALTAETASIDPIVISTGTGAAKPSASLAASSWTKPSTKAIQQALKNAGFYQGSVDGKMGPVTREAVRQFQSVHGLKVDGVVGKRTWQTLASYQDLSGSGGEVSLATEALK